MQYWRDLRVRSKILLALGTLLFSLLGVGALSLLEMERTNSIVEAISGDWLPTVVYTANLRNAVQRFRIQESKVLIAQLAHGDGLAAAKQSMTKAAADVDDIFAAFKRLATVGKEDEAFAGAFDTSWSKYHASAQRLLEIAESGDEKAAAAYFNGPDFAFKDHLTEILANDIAFNTRGGTDAAGEAQRSYRKGRSIIAASLILGVCVGGFIGFALISGLVVPIGKTTEAIERLAAGELDVAVEGVERRDEIGSLVRALDVFKRGMANARSLEMQSRDVAARAEVERKNLLNSLADRFDEQVNGIVDGVSAAAEKLHATASALSEAATSTTDRAMNVAAATEQASGAVGSVASATEQLAASVAEIGAQMRRSQRAANEAAEKAEKADDQMIGLSAAAEKIGGIVGVITDIAARTNLLALNATIEAARAGEAGRGFSVVAQEVKSLAEQTAKATAEVSAQVASVQNSTQIAAGFIGQMAKTTEEVSDAAATVATSVDEQGLATREIAKSISEASISSTQVASNIAGLINAARESSDASSNMLHSTTALSQQASELRTEVARFLQSVRAA